MDELSEVQKQRAARILADALALMNHGGRHWYKGDFKGTTSEGKVGYCAIGALRQAAFGTIHAGAALHNGKEYLLARSALATAAGGSVTGWNDAPKRTWAEVRTGFMKAIKSLKK